MPDSTENTEEEVVPTFQPHFDYDAWKEAGEPETKNEKRAFITKGFDMFATKDYYYIVRSDLDRPMFMKIGGLHDPKYKGKIYDLPDAYQDGDHYFGDSGVKYVIHGNQVHSCTSLSKDTGSLKNKNINTANDRHKGMHYFIHNDKYHVVQRDMAVKYPSLYNTSEDVGTLVIHKKLAYALCYFSFEGYYYVVKMVNIGGGTEKLCFYKVKDLTVDPGLNYMTINKSIQLFLPGGYTIDNPAKAVWESIGYIENQSDDELEYNHEYKFSHGSNKSETSSMEHHWDFEFEEEGEAGAVIAKASIKTTQKYGGSNTETTSDEWSESSEETISINVKLASGAARGLWQPTVKLGGEKTIIAGRNIVVTNGDEPNHPPWE
ncbi:MAG: hypothetical protein HEP71_16545 [Roseivirga sp.]|nr:hypothetical protein [Roseivirga sp.]